MRGRDMQYGGKGFSPIRKPIGVFKGGNGIRAHLIRKRGQLRAVQKLATSIEYALLVLAKLLQQFGLADLPPPVKHDKLRVLRAITVVWIFKLSVSSDKQNALQKSNRDLSNRD